MTPRAQVYGLRFGGLVLASAAIGGFTWALLEGASPSVRTQVALASFLVFVGAAVLWRRSDRIRRRPVDAIGSDEAIPALTTEPYVLYLRSFAADEVQARGVSITQFRTREQRLASILSWVGRPIAIGSPTNGKDFAGFERSYLGTDWQTTMTALLPNAELVVLRVGSSPSVRWELDTSLSIVRFDQLVWLVDNPEGYALLRDAMRSHRIELPGPPAFVPGSTAVVWIDESGARIDIVRPGPLDLVSPLLGDRRLEIALRPTLRRAGASRPSALWLLGTVVVVVTLFFAATGMPPFGYESTDHAAALQADHVVARSEAAVGAGILPADFELLGVTFLGDFEANAAGAETILAEADYSSSLREQSVSITVRAHSGWPRISDARELTQLGAPVETLAGELCTIVEDAYGTIDRRLIATATGESGWHLECTAPEGATMDLPVTFAGETSYAGLLIDDIFFVIDATTYVTRACATAPALGSEEIIEAVLDGLRDPGSAHEQRTEAPPQESSDGGSPFVLPDHEPPAGAADYSVYRLANAEDLAIVACVPDEWTDGALQRWSVGGEDAGPAVVLAPDVDAFRFGWSTPGVIIAASDPAPLTVSGYLDSRSLDPVCEYVGRFDFDDGRHTGMWDLWDSCGPDGGYFLVFAAEPLVGDYLVVVDLLALDRRDFAAAAEIVRTLLVDIH